LGRAGSLGKGRQPWEGQAALGRAGSLGKGRQPWEGQAAYRGATAM